MINVLFFMERLSGGGAEKALCNLVNSLDPSKFHITVHTLWREDPSKYLKPSVCYRFCYHRESMINRVRYRLEAKLGSVYRNHLKGDYQIEVAYMECGATKILSASTNQNVGKIAWVHCDLKYKMPDPQAFVKKTADWYRRFDKIICVSEDVKRSFDQMFPDEREKTIVLHNTVPWKSFRLLAAQTPSGMCSKKRLTVVSAGRLCWQKGYDRLLRVDQLLTSEGCGFDLWILGEGEQRAELENYIRENGLGDSVRLLGFQENPYPYLQAADVLVCSSRYEGFSTFITEGLVLGKAIVSTDCTGVREQLGQSEYGLVVENTEAALSEGIRRMVTDSDLRSCYEKKALERGNTFSEEMTTERVEALFMSCMR